jgi:hypothetical protein
VSWSLYGLFAWRAFWFWLGAHALALVAVALAASIADLSPPEPGVGSGVWMVAMTAALLCADVLRNRERLLLHDLGVRTRVLVPLVVAPMGVLEVVVVIALTHGS